MSLSLSPVSNKMFPLGCLIRKKATGITIFSSPVAALDNADLAMSNGCDVKMYSFIPSGDAADACQARPEIAHATIATFANTLRRLVIADPLYREGPPKA